MAKQATSSEAKKRANRKPSQRMRKESPDCTELLVLELQEIHSAESQLSRALPRFVKVATSESLQPLLDKRLQEGEQIIEALETALDELEESPGRKKNVAAEGLINDIREHIQEIETGPALDSLLIAALQKTEHYCIAAWGTARALAQAVGQKTTVKAMERAIKEGKSLDERLTQLAEQEITPQLLSEASGEEDEEGEEADADDDEATGSRGSRRGSGPERRAPH